MDIANLTKKMDTRISRKNEKKTSKTNLSLQRKQKEDNVKKKLKKLIGNPENIFNDSVEFRQNSKTSAQSKPVSDLISTEKTLKNRKVTVKNTREITPGETKKPREPVTEQELRRDREPDKDINLRNETSTCSEPANDSDRILNREQSKVLDQKRQSKHTEDKTDDNEAGREPDDGGTVCSVCKEIFPSAEIKSHQLHCLKKRFEKKKSSCHENREALDLRKIHQPGKEHTSVQNPAKEEVLMCQFCNKDLSNLNSVMKNQHVSQCIDKIEFQKDKDSKEKINPGTNSGVLECPICGKVLKTERARKIHVKKCSRVLGITPEEGMKLIDGQTESRKVTKKIPSQFDEDLQMAIAMSSSMSEGQSDITHKLQVPAPKKGKGNDRKGKKKLAGTEPVLLLLQDEEKQKRLSLKVAAMLLPQEFGSDDETYDSLSPVDCEVKIKCAGLNALDGEADSQVKSLWNRCTLDGERLESGQKKDLFYVKSLMPPLVVSQAELGKRSRDVISWERSSRRKSSKSQTDNQCQGGDSLSHGDVVMASTQTAVNLALLEAEDDDISENEGTDITCSGFCPEKVIEIQEDISQTISQKLKDNLVSLVDNPDYSDIQIICKDKTLHAHKVMLAARCPSFLQILTQEPTALQDEACENVLCVLKYLYAGEISITQSSLGEVRKIAERFRITELSEICQNLESRGNSVHVDSVEDNPNAIETDILHSPDSDFFRMSDSETDSLQSETNVLNHADSEANVKHIDDHDEVEPSILDDKSKDSADGVIVYNVESSNERMSDVDLHKEECVKVIPMEKKNTNSVQNSQGITSNSEVSVKDDFKVDQRVDEEVMEIEDDSNSRQGDDDGHLNTSDNHIIDDHNVGDNDFGDESFDFGDNLIRGVDNHDSDIDKKQDLDRKGHDIGEDSLDFSDDHISFSDKHLPNPDQDQGEDGGDKSINLSDDHISITSDHNVDQDQDMGRENLEIGNNSFDFSDDNIDHHGDHPEDVDKCTTGDDDDVGDAINSDLNDSGTLCYKSPGVLHNETEHRDNEAMPNISFNDSFWSQADLSTQEGMISPSTAPKRQSIDNSEMVDMDTNFDEDDNMDDCEDENNKRRSTESSTPIDVRFEKGDNFSNTPGASGSGEIMGSPVSIDTPVVPKKLFKPQRVTSRANKQDSYKTPVSNVRQRRKDHMNRPVIPSPFTPMPSYDQMGTPILKKEVQRYGVKPVGKKRMILLLKDIYQRTHEYETDSEFEKSNNDLDVSDLDLPSGSNLNTIPSGGDLGDGPSGGDLVICDSDEEDDMCMASQESDRSDLIEESYSEVDGVHISSSPVTTDSVDLSQKFRNFITDNSDVHRKVLLCEPLELDLLKKEMKEGGIKCSMEKLMEFLDEMCITFTMKNCRKRENKKKKTKASK